MTNKINATRIPLKEEESADGGNSVSFPVSGTVVAGTEVVIRTVSGIIV